MDKTIEKQAVAAGILDDCIYTVIYEFAGKVVDSGYCTEKQASEIANEVLGKMGTDSKLRKRPVPRKKIEPASGKIGIVNATLKHMRKDGIENLTWEPLGKTGFIMCTDLIFQKGRLVTTPNKEVMGFFKNKFIIAEIEDIPDLIEKGFKKLNKSVYEFWKTRAQQDDEKMEDED